MTASRKKLITGTVFLLGIGVLVVAAIMFQRPLREQFWIWKLKSANTAQRRRAAEKLVELGSINAISALVEAAAVAAASLSPEWDWRVRLDTSQIVLVKRPVASPVTLRTGTSANPSLLLDYPKAIQSIASGLETMPMLIMLKARVVPYLSDEREIARAVAASVIAPIQGWGRPQKYVSERRLIAPRTETSSAR